MGYWPASLFVSLSESASQILWGGLVTNQQKNGQHTSTQMGSGHFPEEWDHIINIYLSGSLSTKTKESRINESQKKKVLHNNFFFFFLKHGQFTFYI